MQPGERYVSVHTHPGGQSFSAHDAAVLVAHHQRLIVVVVVGAQGVWYVLSVNPDRAPASPGEVYDACFQEHIAPALERLKIMVQNMRCLRYGQAVGERRLVGGGRALAPSAPTNGSGR